MSFNWFSFTECGSIIRIDIDKYLVGWGKRTWLEKMQNSSAPFFYFPDFFLEHSIPWFQHEHTAIFSYENLRAHIPNSISPYTIAWRNPHFKLFENTFQELQNSFIIGSLKKAVPYVFEESDSTIDQKKLSFSLGKMLSYTQPIPLHVYGFWDKHEGILGASPEILFKYSGQHTGLIETIACAGTKNNKDTQNDFLNDPKEIKEHQIVVQGIIDSLSPYGKVKTGQMRILQLPKLSHLITPIEVEVNGKMDFFSIVNALHPTPALGAFPQKEGRMWLKSYQQKMHRKRYGAPVGFILPEEKQARCIVGIRNVQWDSQGSKIGGGCGIVPESILEKEWQEICLKISSIKELLSL